MSVHTENKIYVWVQMQMKIKGGYPETHILHCDSFSVKIYNGNGICQHFSNRINYLLATKVFMVTYSIFKSLLHSSYLKYTGI